MSIDSVQKILFYYPLKVILNVNTAIGINVLWKNSYFFVITLKFLVFVSFKLCTGFIYIKEDIMNKKNTDFYT